jgi:hypothetical protein
MAAITLGSCAGNKKPESGKSAEDLKAEYAGRRETMPVQTFTFKGDSSATLSAKSGLLIYVPADAFTDDSGKYFGGTVTLKLKEAVRAEEWMNFGLETLAEGKPVFCAGMFHFSAEGGGRSLKLAEGAYLRLSVPEPPKPTASRGVHSFRWAANKNDYRLYSGTESAEGVTWRATEAEVYAESADFDKLKNDYAVVARWVKMVREQRKNPKPKAFAGVDELTRYSFSWDKAAFTQHWIGNKLYGDVHTFAVSEPVRKALSVSGPPVGNFNFAVAARGGKGAGTTRNAKAGATVRVPVHDLTDRFKAARELVCGYEAAAGFAQLKAAFGAGERMEVNITQTGWVALHKPLAAQAVEFKGKILAADGKPADYARIHLLAPGVHLYRHVQGGDYSLLYPAGESFKLIAVQDQKTAQTDAAFKMAGDAVPDLKLPQ